MYYVGLCTQNLLTMYETRCNRPVGIPRSLIWKHILDRTIFSEELATSAAPKGWVSERMEAVASTEVVEWESL